jgi:uncharacterized protein YjiS (DUF1127 family)
MSAARQESGLRRRRLPKVALRPEFLGFPARIRRFMAAIDGWRERWRTRRHLTRLSDYMLKDIGISRADVTEEAEKPFWRE